MTKIGASVKSSPRHKEVKKRDRIRKKVKARKLNFDADQKVPRFEFKVSVLKDLVNSGPYYTCAFCNRNLYKYSVISDDVFSHVTSFDGKSYI